MDFTELEGATRSKVESIIERSAREKQLRIEAEEARARLLDAMFVRRNTMNELSSFADQPSQDSDAVSPRAIALGVSAIPTPEGNLEERQVFATVQNTYFDRVPPRYLYPELLDLRHRAKIVDITFFVRSFPSDAARGMRAPVENLSLGQDQGAHDSILGFEVAREHYDMLEAPVPEDMIPAHRHESSIDYKFRDPDTYDADQAQRALAIINAQLPSMVATLELLRSATQQDHPDENA